MLQKTILTTLLFFGISVASLNAMDLGDVAAMLPEKEPSAVETVAKVEGNDLTNMLVSQLGVTQKQATGGAGSILNYAKESLSAEDFSKVASSVPGVDSLLGAAPSTGGVLGGAASALGGDSLGGMAALTSQFSSLGLNADMVQKFTPIILDYVKGTGGSDVMSLLSGLF